MSTSPARRAARRPKKPPPEVAVAATEAGFDSASLLCGDRAGREAGYGGAAPGKSLAMARRRGDFAEFSAVGPDGTYWFPSALLRQFREERLGPNEADATPPAQAWAEDGDVGSPVGRVEHELELENVRLRERLAASEADRERLGAELARAQAAAGALGAALAALTQT